MLPSQTHAYAKPSSDETFSHIVIDIPDAVKSTQVMNMKYLWGTLLAVSVIFIAIGIYYFIVHAS
jgi:hypothetical protein